jgi:hypothetical protein
VCSGLNWIFISQPYTLTKETPKLSQHSDTVFLSFLECERYRTVTVFDYSFQSVTALRLDRYRSPFLSVHERFLAFYERFRSFCEGFRSFHDVLLRLWTFLPLMLLFVYYLPLLFIIRIPEERLKQVTNDRKRS